MGTHYESLGIDPHATEHEIQRAFHGLARRHHPDTNPGVTGAELEAMQRRMAEINAAYAVLSDPDRRAEYDARIGIDPDRDAWTPPQVPEGFDLFPRRSLMMRTIGEPFHRHADARYRALSLEAWSVDLSPLTALRPDGLWKLVASGLPVTDDQLRHLSGMRSLRVLKLPGTRVTDAGLEHLLGLDELRELNLWDTKITDAGLEGVGRMRSLEVLEIGGTRITDEGLVHLTTLAELDTLDLRGTRVRGRGLAHVHGLHGLEWIRLPWRVSRRARRSLQEALPHARIH